MNIKKEFYTLKKEDFDSLINNLKSLKTTLSFKLGEKTYYYYEDNEINNLLIKINRLMVEFDLLIGSFFNFTKDQIIQSFLLDEIYSTNKIENIQSTRHDIFYIINNIDYSINKKIASIALSYSLLVKEGAKNINNFDDLKKIYNYLFLNTLNKDDLIDGTYFRKKEVNITDGINIIHKGINKENNIEEAMILFLLFYNNNEYDPVLKNIICHFIFETIHPYYDGNGRFGRYLFSNNLFKETNSLFSLTISKAFNENKSKYYKAFKDAEDYHEFNFINVFVKDILLILIDELIKLIDIYKRLKVKRDNLKENIKLTKTENKVYLLIKEATLFSYYGINNEEILNELKISKRSLMYALKKIREEDLLIDNILSGTTFHKIKF